MRKLTYIFIFLVILPDISKSMESFTWAQIEKEVELDKLIEASDFSRIKQLFDAGHYTHEKIYPLTYAIRGNSIPAIVPLLKVGFSINQPDQSGNTALREAVRTNNRKAMGKLLGNTTQVPSLYYLENGIQKHIYDLVKRRVLTQRSELSPGAYNALRKIGKALIQFEGLYAYRSRIAKQGLAQKFPTDVVKNIAIHCKYQCLEDSPS